MWQMVKIHTATHAFAFEPFLLILAPKAQGCDKQLAKTKKFHEGLHLPECTRSCLTELWKDTGQGKNMPSLNCWNPAGDEPNRTRRAAN